MTPRIRVTFRQLGYFVAVGETDSIARAAERTAYQYFATVDLGGYIRARARYAPAAVRATWINITSRRMR